MPTVPPLPSSNPPGKLPNSAVAPGATGMPVAAPKPTTPPPSTASQAVFTRPPAGQPVPGQPAPSSVPAAMPQPSVPKPVMPQPAKATSAPMPSIPLAQPKPVTPAAPIVAPAAAVSPNPPPKSMPPAAVQPGMPLPTPPPQAKPGVVPAPKLASMPTPGVAPAPQIPPAPGLPAAAPKPGVPPVATATTSSVTTTVPGTVTPPKFGSAAPAAPVRPALTKAEVKKPPFWLFAIIGVVLLGILGYFLFSAFGGGSSAPVPVSNSTGTQTAGGTAKAPASNAKPTTLVYWGLWEPNEVMLDTFKEFEKQYPQYTIDYRKQSFKDYRERLQTAIASGNGPDLFRFHANWTPMLREELAAVPNSVMSTSQFENTFYPVAAQQLEMDGKIVGIPVEYDGLALYYNKTILQAANATPPTTWAELKGLADTLTVPSNKSERDRAPLQRAGMAIGNATNVEHFSDILGLLILQNGGDPSAPTSNEVRDALLFYTNFIKEDKVWSDAMPSSTIAFARGDVAMMLAPSWRALDVKAMNPALDFGVAPVPKLGDKRIGWATYWAEGVNSKSKNQTGAWTFINFLASAEGQKQFFSSASQVRAFGEPYARQDLAKELATDPILSNILADAPTAKSWYLTSYTHDNGLNDQLIKYYGDAITATLTGKGMEEILTTLSAGTTQVLRQYGIEAGQAVPATP